MQISSFFFHKAINPPDRIVYFDYFRAIAILMVVMGHCYGPWVPDHIMEMSVANLITGATAVFVFISGFFFHSVFNRNYKYSDFVRKKIINIGIPYLVLSTALMMAALYFDGQIKFQSSLNAYSDINNSTAFFFNLLSGRTATAYWYVPFILTIFIASPFFRWTMKLSNNQTLALLLISFSASIFIHLSHMNINPIHSFLYLMPFYIFGILYSKNRTAVNPLIKKHFYTFLVVTVGIALFMSNQGQLGNLHKLYPWSPGGFDFMVPQKIAMILLLLSLTMRLERWRIPILNYLASISFALFFVHPWILLSLDLTLLYKMDASGGVIFITRFIITMSVSIFIINFLKRVLKKRSKYIIGY